MASNILQPIDPLDISFSQDKCVKTPSTNKTSTKHPESPSYPPHLRKDPTQLFEHKQRMRPSSSSSFTASPCPSLRSPAISRFQAVYKPICRYPDIELRGWSNNRSHRIRSTTQVGASVMGRESQADRLDLLIRRVNARIQVSKRLCRG